MAVANSEQLRVGIVLRTVPTRTLVRTASCQGEFPQLLCLINFFEPSKSHGTEAGVEGHTAVGQKVEESSHGLRV